MTTSSDDAASILERYQIHIGVGFLLVIALGVMLLLEGGADGQDALRSADTQASIPPIPTTEVKVVENEVIEQIEVDYDASLELTAVASAE